MTVVRPILVSFAFAVVAPLTCRLIVKPTTLSLNRHRAARPTSKVAGLLMLRQTAFAIHTLLLIALVAASAYAGTSSLLAAYIAGATISWWDSEVPHRGTQAEPNEASTLREASTSDENQRHGEEKPKTQSNMRSDVENITAGTAIYEHYYAQVVSKILQPFFFASIGLSIPITRMFSGYIVWRGIIYSILMTVGKLVCGLWLVRLPVLPAGGGLQKHLTKLKLPKVPHFWGKSDVTAKDLKNAGPGEAPAEATTPGAASKPLSLYPPLILALAMTARGEIGFLISAVSESKGVFYPPPAGESLGHESDIFLVVTWAIVLCTIIGPLGVGLCVRRVKTLEERKKRDHGGRGKDVLGVWGIE